MVFVLGRTEGLPVLRVLERGTGTTRPVSRGFWVPPTPLVLVVHRPSTRHPDPGLTSLQNKGLEAHLSRRGPPRRVCVVVYTESPTHQCPSVLFWEGELLTVEEETDLTTP